MSVVVKGVEVVVGGVNPEAVVNEAVAVVVHAVAAVGFELSHVGGQVFMVVVNTGVNDHDHHVATAGGEVPGFGRINVGVKDASKLHGVVQTPERAEQRVIGRSVNLDEPVGLGVEHVGVLPVGADGLPDLQPRRQVDKLQVRNGAVAVHRPGAHLRVRVLDGQPGRARLEPHQKLAGRVLGRGLAAFDTRAAAIGRRRFTRKRAQHGRRKKNQRSGRSAPQPLRSQTRRTLGGHDHPPGAGSLSRAQENNRDRARLQRSMPAAPEKSIVEFSSGNPWS